MKNQIGNKVKIKKQKVKTPKILQHDENEIKVVP